MTHCIPRAALFAVLLLAASVLAAAPTSGAPQVCDAAGGPGAVAEGCATPDVLPLAPDHGSLLQLAKRSTATAGAVRRKLGGRKGRLGCPCGDRAALAFQGNGFRAFSSYVGLTAGLLRTAHRGGAGGLGNLWGCYRKYSTVSSGTFYFESLVYSSSFLDLQEQLAHSPAAESGALFAKEWMDPLIAACEMPAAASACGLPQNITLFNQVYLKSTAGLPSHTTVGSPVNPFFKDRYWFAGSSIVSPGGVNFSDYDVSLLAKLIPYATVKGQIRTGGALPSDRVSLYTPAKFGVRLGSSQSLAAPFCSQETCEGYEMTYSGNSMAGTTASPTGPLPAAFNEAFGDVGSLPLASVSAASSAAAGVSVLQGILVTRALLSQAVFASNAPGGRTFVNADSALDDLYAAGTKDATSVGVDRIASQGLIALVDGAFTDNTGILHAVTSGATTVTSYLNDAVDLFNLFNGGMLNMFGNNPFVFARLYFQIFETPKEEVEDIVKEFPCLKVPPTAGTSMPWTNNVAPYLTSLCFGTIKTRTVANRLAGVQGGQDVTINAIIVLSSIGLQLLPTESSPALVSEIQAAFSDQENADLVRKLHRDFFPQTWLRKR